MQSIDAHGWSRASFVTVVRDEDYQADNKTEEEEKLVQQLSAEQQSIIVRGRWKLIDGMHRCAAVVELFQQGKLSHPFLPATIMAGSMSPSEIQALAFAENLVKEQHVYVSLFDNLTMVRRTSEMLKSQGLANSAYAIAAHLSQLSKSSGFGTQFRTYTSIEAHLCDEAKLLLKEDAQRHVRSIDCVFSRNNLYSTSPPLYNRHALVQVAVMKRMLVKVDEMQKVRTKDKSATRVHIEHKQINQWVVVCESVHQQILLSDSHCVNCSS
jgi:hypothetical protein